MVHKKKNNKTNWNSDCTELTAYALCIANRARLELNLPKWKLNEILYLTFLGAIRRAHSERIRFRPAMRKKNSKPEHWWKWINRNWAAMIRKCKWVNIMNRDKATEHRIKWNMTDQPLTMDMDVLSTQLNTDTIRSYSISTSNKIHDTIYNHADQRH